MNRLTVCTSTFSLLLLSAQIAAAGAVRQDSGFMTTDMGANDDGSSNPVQLGFEIGYSGEVNSELYVSNNGYVVFNQPGGEQFTSTIFNQRLMAAFFADVDTTGSASGTVHWGTDTVDGHRAFAVTWPQVGYFLGQTDRLNTFQMVLIEREDRDAGDFDLEFNYDTVTWDCGQTECAEGQETHAAQVGFADGSNEVRLPGSGTPGAFLDSNAETGLALTSHDSAVLGRHVFQFRKGAPPLTPGGNQQPPPGPGGSGWPPSCSGVDDMPPSSGQGLAVLLASVAALGWRRRR